MAFIQNIKKESSKEQDLFELDFFVRLLVTVVTF